MKKFWEKIKANSVLIMIVAMILLLAFVSYQCGVSKETKRTAEIFEKQAKDIERQKNEEIKDLEKENEELEGSNREKDKIIVVKEKENEDLMLQREEDKKRIEEMKKKVEKAIPVKLVEVTRRILVTDEIWWDKESKLAEFSLMAFRTNTAKLVDWEDFTTKREPSYQLQIENDAVIKRGQIEKLANLAIEASNWKLIVKKEQEKYEALNNAFQEFERYARRKGGLLEKILCGLAGYGVAKILD